MTLSAAARMMRDALRDKSYQDSPLGLVVARYVRWKRTEWGATAETMRDYERTVARLALFYADLLIEDFEPPMGTERVREVWDHYWSDRTERTRAKVLSIYRDLFSWAVNEGLLHGNPALRISRPKQRGVERGVFSPNAVETIIGAQPRLRDRVALRILFRLGLRKGELARLQFKHYDGSRKRLQVKGKGGKVRYVPVPEDIALDLERHMLERQAESDEFLLYPEKLGPVSYGGPVDVIWETRHKGMSSTAMHRWWGKCIERAGVPYQPMHEARHTAITELVRFTGNLKLAQQLAGHASIQTTADIYAHLDDVDLEKALRRMTQGA